MPKSRKIPRDHPFRLIEPATRSRMGCTEWAVNKWGDTTRRCTRPAGHEGVHVRHAHWSAFAPAGKPNLATHYWVRGE